MARHYYSRPDSELEPGPVLLEIFDKLSAGDVLETPDVSHLALSWNVLAMVLYLFETKGAILKPLRIGGSAGEPIEQRFRADLRRAATARARARGAYRTCTGRPRRIDRDEVRRLRDSGMTPAEIAAQLGARKSAVYDALREG
jgi:hypothetical protein